MIKKRVRASGQPSNIPLVTTIDSRVSRFHRIVIDAEIERASQLDQMQGKHVLLEKVEWRVEVECRPQETAPVLRADFLIVSCRYIKIKRYRQSRESWNAQRTL